MIERLAKLSSGAAVLLLVVMSVPSANGATPVVPETFAHRTARASLIVLVDVHYVGHSVVLDVERVLKGRSAARLVFPNLCCSPVESTWRRAVIALDRSDTFDFRGGATGWHVDAAGRIDPEHFQQEPGLPRTLTAMLAYFQVSAPDTSTVTLPQPAGGPLSWMLVLIASGATFVGWKAASRSVSHRPSPPSGP